jgi:two-component system, OmpR family, sensor histidine kinase KdpD
MDFTRPDPAKLLAKLQEEEASALKGKLKIFFGAAAGVGKTYAMLESAQRLNREGIDILIGCVVTHGRLETENLVQGLKQIEPKVIDYRGSLLNELDIDAVLSRKPKVILIDELAHTNAPGSRHEKRWQDVEELLAAGIDVHTTVNVQHLESANDIVAKITGIRVKETIPDAIFEKADEVVVVDLPADDLLQRLREGKVYLPEQSRFALNNFFRKGNLFALRELALRCTAERVDAQMEKYRTDESITAVWPASERILVCVGPSHLTPRLVRAARRMAAGLHASWIALHVENARSLKMKASVQRRIIRSLRLAEQLGAETTTVTGNNIAEELVAFAKRRNVSKIIIGKPARPRWREIIFGSVVDDTIRASGDIDVYVITGDASKPIEAGDERLDKPIDYKNYVYAVVIVGLTTVLNRLLFPFFSLPNLVMVYLLATVIVALKLGRGASIVSVFLNAAAFDFFFIPPYFSLGVSDNQYLLTIVVMLIVGLILSTLTFNTRQQAALYRARERHTDALYRMTREQALSLTKENVLKTSVEHISDVFDCLTTVLLPNSEGKLTIIDELPKFFELDANEFGVAQWVFINGQRAGIGTSTLPGAKALYLPLLGSKGQLGTIGILPAKPERLLIPEEMHFLETFVNHMALAMERAILSEKLAQTSQSQL